MLARRRFAVCALCAAGGVLSAAVGVKAQAPGLTRTVLNRIEAPGDKMVTLQMAVEIDANFMVARHTHPGTETTYVLEGGGTLGVAGQADRVIKPGDAFQVAEVVPHLLQNGPAKTKLLVIYVVEKDKPLATPAPA